MEDWRATENTLRVLRGIEGVVYRYIVLLFSIMTQHRFDKVPNPNKHSSYTPIQTHTIQPTIHTITIVPKNDIERSMEGKNAMSDSNKCECLREINRMNQAALHLTLRL